MGIYIPNMEKPKDCSNCSFYGSEYLWACEPLQNVDGYECPMVEIDLVRCGECKHRDSEFCQIRESMYGVKDNDFCSYGERSK